jgi:hypothetical protein
MSVRELDVLKSVVELLEAMARYIDGVADLEMRYGKSFGEISEVLSPSTLLEFSKKLSPELFAKLMSILLRLAASGERMRDVWKIPAEEKKKVASEVKSLAEDLKSFLRDIEVYVSREAD